MPFRMLHFLRFSPALFILLIVANCKLFEKAGKPGWASLIPVYNLLVILEIIRRPWWWLLLFFVPLANIVILFKMSGELAECFGKSRGWGYFMLTILAFVGYPILGLSDAKYTAPARQI